jgi:hypothetical protein
MRRAAAFITFLMRHEHTIKETTLTHTSRVDSVRSSPSLSAISTYIKKTKEWDTSLLKPETAVEEKEVA